MTRRRGFLLALAYVLGMAITYTLAGIAAGLSGSRYQRTAERLVLGGFALVFVLLALSMFGFYELQLPAVLQSRASGLSNRLPGGRFLGVFAMGALSALIVSPCVAAPLAGALLYIGQSNNVALGGAALFALALGMGVPLLAVGLSAGTLLPKAGPWMESVKRFFGVVLLAWPFGSRSPVLPLSIQMLTWALCSSFARFTCAPSTATQRGERPHATGQRRGSHGPGGRHSLAGRRVAGSRDLPAAGGATRRRSNPN
jgi:thiol:disulfide interchange protein DsbD